MGSGRISGDRLKADTANEVNNSGLVPPIGSISGSALDSIKVCLISALGVSQCSYAVEEEMKHRNLS